MTTVVIGTTFPKNWQYGPEEIEIVKLTAEQIKNAFSDQQNLLINTTWFGPQFDNNEWQKLNKISSSFDNLFLLSVIDPMYLTEQHQNEIKQKFNIKNTYNIGMFADSKYEWNFHSFTTAELCPDYTVDQLKLVDPKYTFLLYQRKPRTHRIELTQILFGKNLNLCGLITLGSNKNSNYDWSNGLKGPTLLIEEDPTNYMYPGKHDDFGGVPNDLVSIGRLDIWQQHFLNVVSETVFDEWNPRFISEKTWKPILGLRPFIIHGQRSIYDWLKKHGFYTFNQYWSHIPVETDSDQHGNVVRVIEFLSSKTKEELSTMYNNMLPNLLANRERFFQFAQEQRYKMEHIF